MKSKHSPGSRRHIAVDLPDSPRNQQLLAAQWNHLHGAGGGAAAGASASDDDSGCGIEEFAWVPVGLTPAQVRLRKLLASSSFDRNSADLLKLFSAIFEMRCSFDSGCRLGIRQCRDDIS